MSLRSKSLLSFALFSIGLVKNGGINQMMTEHVKKIEKQICKTPYSCV